MPILGRGDWPSRDLAVVRPGVRDPWSAWWAGLTGLRAGSGQPDTGVWLPRRLQVVASAQAPSRRVRPRPMRLRRLSAAVRRFSQALLAATPR